MLAAKDTPVPRTRQLMQSGFDSTVRVIDLVCSSPLSCYRITCAQQHVSSSAVMPASCSAQGSRPTCCLWFLQSHPSGLPFLSVPSALPPLPSSSYQTLHFSVLAAPCLEQLRLQRDTDELHTERQGHTSERQGPPRPMPEGQTWAF